MSGDATSPARDCLKGEEVDPTGQAKLCQDGKDLITETVQPTAISLPTVGASVNLIMPVIFTLILVALAIFIGILKFTDKEK